MSTIPANSAIIRASVQVVHPALPEEDLERRTAVILKDLILLARCARSRCLVTYKSAIDLRGHGIARNGRWLDEVYAHAIAPLAFPDLTMLVVNQDTSEPSPDAFNARRSVLSKIHIADVKGEQRRCIWYPDYEAVLGPLDTIPAKSMHSRLLADEPPKEREIARAVRNAVGRVTMSGTEKTLIGREYPDSLPMAELLSLAADLWVRQDGRCALTGQKFELRANDEGGVQDDRVSLDRIDNLRGYAFDNVQLVTQFANRARGTLSCDAVRLRLTQFR
ncbi:hypothetical protein FHT87_005881 [Rhizobium sp. BK316]|uniref:hypothetical protein n=1 Tax=Rhizobium sp. BK316 TaxID=2587053 RepID=UPI00161BC08F|nr:hypothetical protein [Rhizobium sp. BK316]MBB3411914.1 hypothetical protein [Rhizobium sp. BK316]